MVGLPGFLNGLMSCPVVRSHIFPYPNLDAHRCGLILFHYFIASFQVGELLLVPISEWQISTRRRCHVEPFCGSPAALLPQSKKVSSIIFSSNHQDPHIPEFHDISAYVPVKYSSKISPDIPHTTSSAGTVDPSIVTNKIQEAGPTEQCRCPLGRRFIYQMGYQPLKRMCFDKQQQQQQQQHQQQQQQQQQKQW